MWKQRCIADCRPYSRLWILPWPIKWRKQTCEYMWYMYTCAKLEPCRMGRRMVSCHFFQDDRMASHPQAIHSVSQLRQVTLWYQTWLAGKSHELDGGGNGKVIYKWGFSIAMFDCRRVYPYLRRWSVLSFILLRLPICTSSFELLW